MIVLWEPMYPGDARGKIPTGFFAGDPRVSSYWDPTEISGRWLADHPFAGLGGNSIVWDAYYAFQASASLSASLICVGESRSPSTARCIFASSRIF